MTAALEEGEWSAARPGCNLPPEKTRYPLYRRLNGPQRRSGRAENLAPPGFDPWTVQPVVRRYTVWTTRPTLNQSTGGVIVCFCINIFYVVISYKNYFNACNVHRLLFCTMTKKMHLKCLFIFARYWLQAPWGWYDSVEISRNVIIGKIIVHLLVIVQNNKRCTLQALK
jgi:hypothetical protein